MPDFENILCNHFRCEIISFQLLLRLMLSDLRLYFVSVLQDIFVSISVSLNKIIYISVSISVSVNEYNTVDYRVALGANTCMVHLLTAQIICQLHVIDFGRHRITCCELVTFADTVNTFKNRFGRFMVVF